MANLLVGQLIASMIQIFANIEMENAPTTFFSEKKRNDIAVSGLYFLVLFYFYTDFCTICAASIGHFYWTKLK